MSEIKSRGKRIEDGEWMHGDLITETDADFKVIRAFIHLRLSKVDFSQNSMTSKIILHEVDPETVGQYAELEDKNGKEIYEGYVLSNGQHIDWIVIKHEGSFKVKHVGSIVEDKWFLTREMAESREIIGNIYENPELLKGESL